MKIKQQQVWLGATLIIIIIAIFLLEHARPPISSAWNSSGEITLNITSERVLAKAQTYPRAVEIADPSGFLNTNNLTIASLIGKKVILVDFWTYSCINCQRTTPYLNAWYEKYRDQGLEIIGVHTPEFEFEKNHDNVADAITQYGIQYPVVQDNNRATWYAYRNRFWPRKYLIDIDGFIVYDHIGEGAYAETEGKIIEALEERKRVLGLDETIVANQTASDPFTITPRDVTPEIYFGYKYARAQLGSLEGWVPDEVVTYRLPTRFSKDMFYLQGSWENNADHMQLESEQGMIVLKYLAKEVHMVAGSELPTTIEVYIDNAWKKNVTIEGHRLYTLFNESTHREHMLELHVSKDLRAYTFTFG